MGASLLHTTIARAPCRSRHAALMNISGEENGLNPVSFSCHKQIWLVLLSRTRLPRYRSSIAWAVWLDSGVDLYEWCERGSPIIPTRRRRFRADMSKMSIERTTTRHGAKV